MFIALQYNVLLSPIYLDHLLHITIYTRLGLDTIETKGGQRYRPSSPLSAIEGGFGSGSAVVDAV